MDRFVNGLVDGWINEWTDRWVDGWVAVATRPCPTARCTASGQADPIPNWGRAIIGEFGDMFGTGYPGPGLGLAIIGNLGTCLGQARELDPLPSSHFRHKIGPVPYIGNNNVRPIPEWSQCVKLVRITE